MGPDLWRESPCDLGHRRQKRQGAGRRGDRLIGDADSPRGDEIPGLLRVRRKVQIGEQDLTWPQALALLSQRLLDLHHHLGIRKDRVRAVDDFSSGAAIVLIGEA
jgi:hypothetical protein